MDKSNFLTGLGKRIESRRRELNITQSELAKKVGYSSHSTIAKAEAGLINLRRKTPIFRYGDIRRVVGRDTPEPKRSGTSRKTSNGNGG